MKKSLILGIVLALPLYMTNFVFAQDKEEKKEIKITVKDEGQGSEYEVEVITDKEGQKKVFKRSYSSLEEMESDSTISVHVKEANGKQFDIKIEELPDDFKWLESADSADHKIIKSKDGNFIFIHGDEDDIEHRLRYFTDSDSNKMVHKYEIKILKDGESSEDLKEIEKDILILKEGEGNFSINEGGKDERMVWIGDENKKTKKIMIRKSVINKASISDYSPGDEDFPDFNLNGITALSLKNINYYPNPNEGEFTLTFSGSKKPVVVRILDQKGNLMYEDDVKNFTGIFNKVLNVKSFDKGIYLLQIHQQGKVLNRKLTLE